MTSHGVGWKMMVNFFDMTSDCHGHRSRPENNKLIWLVNLIKSCNLIGWIWDNQINASQYLLLAINIWDDWVMNSARLLADSPFSSLGVGRISMFKGCGIFLTPILRYRTMVNALIVLLLAPNFWALMRDCTCSRSENKCLSTSIRPSSACATLAVLLVSISARAWRKYC